MTWSRLTPEQALERHDIRTPSRAGETVHVAVVGEGWTAWAYRTEPSAVFARGENFLYWIRRDRDLLEWYGSAATLALAKDAAVSRHAEVAGGR